MNEARPSPIRGGLVRTATTGAPYAVALAVIAALAVLLSQGVRALSERWPAQPRAAVLTDSSSGRARDANERLLSGGAPARLESAAAPRIESGSAGARTSGGSGSGSASTGARDGDAGAGARRSTLDTSARSAAEGVLFTRHLTLPVSGVRPEQLSAGFTQARDERTHEAVDIMAPRGTPVIAVEDGTVAKLFWSNQGGHTIYQFDPSTQYAYYYAHLDRYADDLAEGQAIARGQVIGYVGSTGNASADAPHLHFAIFVLTPAKRWWEGTAIDPYPILRWALSGSGS